MDCLLRNHEPLPWWGALPKGRGDSLQPPFTIARTQPTHQRDTKGLWPAYLLTVVGQREAVDAEARENLLLLLQRKGL